MTTPTTNGKTIPEHVKSIACSIRERGEKAVKAGNRRTLIVRRKSNASLFEVNLTLAIALTVVAFFAATPLVILTAVAAYFLQIRLEVIQEVNSGKPIDVVEMDNGSQA